MGVNELLCCFSQLTLHQEPLTFTTAGGGIVLLLVFGTHRLSAMVAYLLEMSDKIYSLTSEPVVKLRHMIHFETKKSRKCRLSRPLALSQVLCGVLTCSKRAFLASWQ
jgi:hypothetical protein